MKLRFLEPIAFPVAAVAIRLLAATWRLRVQHGEHRTAARATGRPVLFALWHSRILPLLFHHRAEGVVTLISRHRDGGHLARLAEQWGYGTVRPQGGRERFRSHSHWSPADQAPSPFTLPGTGRQRLR